MLLVHSAARLAQVERLIAERTRGAELRFGLRAFTVESAAAALTAAAGAPSAAPDVRVVRIDPELARRLGDGLDLFIQAVRALQVAGADHNKVCPNFYMPALPADELNAFCRRLRHDVLGVPRPSGAKP